MSRCWAPDYERNIAPKRRHTRAPPRFLSLPVKTFWPSSHSCWTRAQIANHRQKKKWMRRTDRPLRNQARGAAVNWSLPRNCRGITSFSDRCASANLAFCVGLVVQKPWCHFYDARAWYLQWLEKTSMCFPHQTNGNFDFMNETDLRNQLTSDTARKLCFVTFYVGSRNAWQDVFRTAGKTVNFSYSEFNVTDHFIRFIRTEGSCFQWGKVTFLVGHSLVVLGGHFY